MTTPIPQHLQLYHDPDYFVGGRKCSGYDDYANCVGVLNQYGNMLRHFRPKSVLDVGAAYGFIVDYFKAFDTPAFGIEPSPVARAHVSETAKPFVVAGALPELPRALVEAGTDGPIYRRFDLVTCTEVLEHVPEDLVPASLQALADKTEGVLVMLIMLEGPGADGDEGHICLKSRDWWNAELDKTGLVADVAAEQYLNDHPYSQSMQWSPRFFVRRPGTVTL